MGQAYIHLDHYHASTVISPIQKCSPQLVALKAGYCENEDQYSMTYLEEFLHCQKTTTKSLANESCSLPKSAFINKGQRWTLQKIWVLCVHLFIMKICKSSWETSVVFKHHKEKGGIMNNSTPKNVANLSDPMI